MTNVRIDIAEIDAIANISRANGSRTMHVRRFGAQSLRRTQVVFRFRIIDAVVGARIFRVQIQFVVHVSLQEVCHLIIAVGCKDPIAHILANHRKRNEILTSHDRHIQFADGLGSQFHVPRLAIFSKFLMFRWIWSLRNLNLSRFVVETTL